MNVDLQPSGYAHPIKATLEVLNRDPPALRVQCVVSETAVVGKVPELPIGRLVLVCPSNCHGQHVTYPTAGSAAHLSYPGSVFTKTPASADIAEAATPPLYIKPRASNPPNHIPFSPDDAVLREAYARQLLKNFRYHSVEFRANFEAPAGNLGAEI